MNLFFFHPGTKARKERALTHELVSIRGQERNINEGGEFIDDGIRMTDQSLAYTKKITGTKSSGDLYDYSAE